MIRTDERVVAPQSASEAERTFSTAVVISAIRCTLTYVAFPFLTPVLGIAAGVGSTVGVIASVIGIAANFFSIQRFRASEHRYKRPIIAVNIGIIVLLAVLLLADLDVLI